MINDKLLHKIISNANNSGVVTIGKIGVEWGFQSITSGSSGTSGLYGGSTTINFVNSYKTNPIVMTCWGGSYINQVDTYSLTGSKTSSTIGGHLTSANSERNIRYLVVGIIN